MKTTRKSWKDKLKFNEESLNRQAPENMNGKKLIAKGKVIGEIDYNEVNLRRRSLTAEALPE